MEAKWADYAARTESGWRKILESLDLLDPLDPLDLPDRPAHAMAGHIIAA
jgi:hypothetical protein